MSDLLDAVDRLTKPMVRSVPVESGHRHDWQSLRKPGRWKRDEEGVWRCIAGDVIPGQWNCAWCGDTTSDPVQELIVVTVVRREDEAALDQLRARVGSSVGGTGSAAQQAKDRVPLDMTAFDLFERIDGQVRAWYLDLGERSKGSVTVAEVLRKWYVRFVQLPRSSDQEASYEHVLDGWWDEVRDIIDPPVRQEITAPCPECKATWVENDDPEVNSPRALWALWRETGDDSEARCLNCDHRWHGVDQMRRLRIRIDEVEAARLVAERARADLLGAAEDDLQPADR